MDPAPTISVVIPVKDDAVLLRRCLAALADQRDRPDEVLVVDNGSTDGSADVAHDAGARVVAELRPGIPAASARGYDEAIGEVIARLDADCVPPPDWIERIRDAFARDAALDAITGPARFIDGPRALRSVLSALYLGSYVATVAPALGHVPLFGSNLALRRDAWRAVRDEVHRHDQLMHDDMDLSVHLGPCRRFRYDLGLRMGISMRALTGGGALRVRRGVHSVVSHWPEEFPVRRWRRRAAWMATQTSGPRDARDRLRRGHPA
ncbi:glycosyltransferase involved in cell wall biosynthesis [Agromyces flavus]|uniref:Glycosyltransferase involved in cell wall biosynthesis n=1 Tax=Agromyces flavus TaxID=589382 RepID=A0A1H1SK47_9MICO|nr:glycosyltransferase family 2 protein [Agromyces flavus]MCP2369028.1 glycosyltransferase involved in cell wall biosynthesis [Agromyces flavus]GGI48483.1 glycosyl hydrolase [Agromyces flavus]SDS47729.1 Glycosyltransferase involved in cell wall bisynthesis [Agromyces flavus]